MMGVEGGDREVTFTEHPLCAGHSALFCQLALTQGNQAYFTSEVGVSNLILSTEEEIVALRVSGSKPEDNLRFEPNSSSSPNLCSLSIPPCHLERVHTSSASHG